MRERERERERGRKRKRERERERERERGLKPNRGGDSIFLPHPTKGKK